MQKRGVFELEVRWVYILFVGAMFLLLFVNVASKQIESGSLVEEAKFANLLGIILSDEIVLRLGSNAEQYVNDCESSSLTIGAATTRWPQGSVVVSPSFFTAQELSISSSYAKMPFAISRFIFINPDGISYVMYDSELSSEVAGLIPGQVAIVGIPLDEGDDFFAVAKRNGQAVRAVSLRAGVINFWQKDGSGMTKIASSQFMGPQILAAAVISGDQKQVQCMMNRMFSQAGSVSEGYEEKAVTLASLHPVCAQDYAHLLNVLQAFKGNSSQGDYSGMGESGRALTKFNSLVRGCEVLF